MNKILTKFSIIFFFFLLSLSISNIFYLTVFAQQIETYKGDLTYYDLINGKGIDWQLKFEPQNNVDKIVSSVVYIDLTSVPTTAENILMELTINRELHCSPEIFKLGGDGVSTGTSKRIKFDCSGVINQSGIYNLHLSATQIIKGIFGSYEIVYYTTPSWQKAIESIEKKINETSWQKSIENIENRLENKIIMGTGGTEYGMNENVRIFVRLLDGNSRPVSLANCWATIYYPNNTKFLNNQSLTLLERGIYYYDFITPNVTGNYITIFDCVTPSIPFIQNVTLQGIELEAGESDQYYEVNFGFDNSNNVTINSAFLEVNVTGSIAGCIIGVDFNNKRLGTLEGKNPALGNYTLTQNDFYLTDDQMLVLIREGTGVDYLWWVRLVVNYTWNNPSQIVRGQDEVHIRSGNVTGGNISYVENALATFGNLRYAGGTEYLSGTEGQIAYQYITTNKGDPKPVNDALCNTTIWYPNNSIFIQNQSMPYLTGSAGIYVTNFTVPTIQGVYKTHAICYSTPKYSYGASTFHVENTLATNQQTIYTFMQAMNTTMVNNQQYIISLVQNVSTQITANWNEFWSSVSARIVS